MGFARTQLLKIWITSAWLIIVLMSSFNAFGADDHMGHSDDLLLLIQHKLRISKLQSQFHDATTDKPDNLARQAALLQRGLKRLQHYVAVSSGHYPNDSLYQQSLENRAAMLSDFAALLATHQRQLGHSTSSQDRPDKDQHRHSNAHAK